MKRTAWFVVVLTVASVLYSALGAALAKGEDPTFNDVPYLNDGHPNHVMDVYVPEGKGRFPVAIVIHGGRNGDESALDSVARNLSDHGFVGVSVDYREWSHPAWSAQMRDMHAAIDWIRSNATMLKADARHFAVLGSSLGGYIAAMLGTGEKAYRPSVVATWSGKLDLTTYRAANSLILGSEKAKDPNALIANSPMQRVRANRSAPWFIANSKCEMVPLSQATGMASALATAGVPNELDVVQKCLHAASYGYIVSDAMIAFFERWV
jgi:acetyl esterase